MALDMDMASGGEFSKPALNKDIFSPGYEIKIPKAISDFAYPESRPKTKNALYVAEGEKLSLNLASTVLREDVDNRKRLLNLHIGRLYILPTIIEQLYYDDNVFLHPTQQRADFVALSSPSLELFIPFRSHELTLGYRGAFYNYGRFNELDRLDHAPYFDLLLSLGKKVEVEIKNRFFYTTSSWEYDVNLELVERRSYVQNQSEAVVRYKFAERFALEAAYRHRFIIFQKGEFARDNWQEDSGSVTFLYALFPKTSVLGEYTFGRVDYTHGRPDDSYYHIVMVGLRGKPTAKMTVEAKVGYQWRQYDHKADAGQNGNRRDFAGPNFYLRLEERFTESTILDVYGEGRVNESYYGNNNYYVSYGGGVRLTQRLFQRLFISINGYWQNNDYPIKTLDEASGKEKKRIDKNWGAEAEARLKIKEWLNLSIRYNHRGRESSHDNFDYVDNQGSLWLKIDL